MQDRWERGDAATELPIRREVGAVGLSFVSGRFETEGLMAEEALEKNKDEIVAMLGNLME